MNLFHLNVRTGHPGVHSFKTWLVVARNAAEAATLLPADQVIVSVERGTPCKPGPARLLGWMGPPPPLPTAVQR